MHALRATGLAGLVVLLDQVTKFWISGRYDLGGGERITSFFNLVHFRNTGISFGMLGSGGDTQRYVLTAIALLVSVFLLAVPGRQRETLAGAGLIAGGALGNALDRLRLGGVTDFLDFHALGYHWPAFNVADASITVGALLLVLGSLLPGWPFGSVRTPRDSNGTGS